MGCELPFPHLPQGETHALSTGEGVTDTQESGIPVFEHKAWHAVIFKNTDVYSSRARNRSPLNGPRGTRGALVPSSHSQAPGGQGWVPLAMTPTAASTLAEYRRSYCPGWGLWAVQRAGRQKGGERIFLSCCRELLTQPRSEMGAELRLLLRVVMRLHGNVLRKPSAQVTLAEERQGCDNRGGNEP